jgi:cytochrome c5
MEGEIAMSLKLFVHGVLMMAMASTLAVTAQKSGAIHAMPKAAVQKQPSEKGEEGARVFEQHCSRCHTAPDGFSPRIAGTIVRHMRVRASLSRHEEEELLRFFNPQ